MIFKIGWEVGRVGFTREKDMFLVPTSQPRPDYQPRPSSRITGTM